MDKRLIYPKITNLQIKLYDTAIALLQTNQDRSFALTKITLHNHSILANSTNGNETLRNRYKEFGSLVVGKAILTDQADLDLVAQLAYWLVNISHSLKESFVARVMDLFNSDRLLSIENLENRLIFCQIYLNKTLVLMQRTDYLFITKLIKFLAKIKGSLINQDLSIALHIAQTLRLLRQVTPLTQKLAEIEKTLRDHYLRSQRSRQKSKISPQQQELVTVVRNLKEFSVDTLQAISRTRTLIQQKSYLKLMCQLDGINPNINTFFLYIVARNPELISLFSQKKLLLLTEKMTNALPTNPETAKAHFFSRHWFVISCLRHKIQQLIETKSQDYSAFEEAALARIELIMAHPLPSTGINVVFELQHSIFSLGALLITNHLNRFVSNLNYHADNLSQPLDLIIAVIKKTPVLFEKPRATNQLMKTLDILLFTLLQQPEHFLTNLSLISKIFHLIIDLSEYASCELHLQLIDKIFLHLGNKQLVEHNVFVDNMAPTISTIIKIADAANSPQKSLKPICFFGPRGWERFIDRVSQIDVLCLSRDNVRKLYVAFEKLLLAQESFTCFRTFVDYSARLAITFQKWQRARILAHQELKPLPIEEQIEDYLTQKLLSTPDYAALQVGFFPPRPRSLGPIFKSGFVAGRKLHDWG